MFNIENEYTTEPTEIQVTGMLEANFVVATLLLNNWNENPGASDLPETWEGAKNLAYSMVNKTLTTKEKDNADGVSVQWTSSLDTTS